MQLVVYFVEDQGLVVVGGELADGVVHQHFGQLVDHPPVCMVVCTLRMEVRNGIITLNPGLDVSSSSFPPR